MLFAKKLLSLCIFLLLILHLGAQKLLVDSSAYGTWPRLGIRAISNNGKFLFYTIHDPVGNHDRLCLQATDGRWKREYIDVLSPNFTQNSEKLIFQQHDTLFFVNLGADSAEYFPNILGPYQYLPRGRNSGLILYRTKQAPNQLAIKEYPGGQEKLVPAPESYWNEPSNGGIAFLTKDTGTSGAIYHLKYINVNDNVALDIYNGDNVENVEFSRDASILMFLTRDSANEKSLWYCRLGKNPTKLATDRSVTTDFSLKLGEILSIDEETNRAILTLETNVQVTPLPPGVDIWNYNDPSLQSRQLYELRQARGRHLYKASINLVDHRILQIENKNQSVLDLFVSQPLHNWVLLHQTGDGDYYSEWNWNKKATASIYLLSLQNGGKKLLATNVAPSAFFTLSPDEKYVLFYDAEKSSYCSYEISTGIIRNLTAAIHDKWTNPSVEDQPNRKYVPIGIGGFSKENDFAYLHAQYDVYQVDLTGKAAPVALTGSYGQAHHIVFRMDPRYGDYPFSRSVVLHALNTDNKDQGFYRVFFDKPGKLDSLTMQSASVVFEKARDSQTFLFSSEDASRSPDVFSSNDLRHFTRVTDLHPEAKYNWLTSELIKWRLPDGNSCQGILYKPENFNPTNRYPIIFHYYERSSDRLHTFMEPELSGADINIPLYVSNGYLVFVPDIFYKIGEPGRSAFDCIVSAAKFLSNRKYIDSHRMGLQGTSFGGFETLYVIAHTNIFSAAMSSSGMSDFISLYGSIIGDGSSRQRQYELYRDRMGATLWQIPSQYAENSPVLRADKITTPLLLMANKNDGDVPFQQGIELFTALRRLGKKAWMLQYDNGGHGLVSLNSKRDFTLRVLQFFNHYLKYDLPPKWMTRGVPAALKGTDSGLELDASGATP
ncbi:MAG TPA: prolyl oligopeptidase family serine peptidase [Puia sp.]|uniref:alpha/beta hydrolase family protein n=1 Tax=Puia sp. TaxID=2045100 RepID=UPI002CDB6CFC|nr:prolyl oligopeptidase family serine peptidase [Puia sp.]HVU95482.1 prolyl oligopeptidase family serine peptidase [Puia sp.]